MDENETPVAEVSEPAAPPATTLKERFKGFALYYILYSFIFSFLFVLVFIASMLYAMSPASNIEWPDIPVLLIPLVIFGGISILPLFPLGMLKAKRGHWTVPTRKESILAVVWPSVVFGIWLAILMLPIWASSIYTFLLYISALCAAPFIYFGFSCCVVVRILQVEWLAFILAPLLSIVLPPLLFALGSFCQAKRQNFSPEG